MERWLGFPGSLRTDASTVRPKEVAMSRSPGSFLIHGCLAGLLTVGLTTRRRSARTPGRAASMRRGSRIRVPGSWLVAAVLFAAATIGTTAPATMASGSTTTIFVGRVTSIACVAKTVPYVPSGLASLSSGSSTRSRMGPMPSRRAESARCSTEGSVRKAQCERLSAAGSVRKACSSSVIR